MKNFDTTTSCPKCGYAADAFIDYKVGVFSTTDQENISTTSFGGQTDEYLLRTCKLCGYKWPERTLDRCVWVE